MDTTQILSIIVGILAAIIIIYLLTKTTDMKKQKQRKSSIVKGFSCFFSNNDNEALDEMRALALADKGTPEIYLAIGFLYRKQGDYTKAAQVHEVLLGNKELDKEYKSYLIAELAKDYVLAGIPGKAIGILKELQNRDENPDNLETLAKAFYQVQNYDNAITYLEKYEKTTGETIQGFYSKCMIAKASTTEDESKIQKYIKNVIQKDPECRSAHFIKAAQLLKEGKKSKAIEEYIYILNHSLPRDEQDMTAIEKAFVSLGEEEQLLNTIKELSKDSKNPFIHIALAKYHMDRNEKDAAEKVLRNYIENIGGNAAIVRYLSDITSDKGLLNILGTSKTYRCSVCRNDFNEYKDDCPVCSSFDTIYTK